MLITRRSEFYYTASGIITPVGGRSVHRLREDGARSAKHQKKVYSVLIWRLGGRKQFRRPRRRWEYNNNKVDLNK